MTSTYCSTCIDFGVISPTVPTLTSKGCSGIIPTPQACKYGFQITTTPSIASPRSCATGLSGGDTPPRVGVPPGFEASPLEGTVAAGRTGDMVQGGQVVFLPRLHAHNARIDGGQPPSPNSRRNELPLGQQRGARAEKLTNVVLCALHMRVSTLGTPA